MTGDDYLEQVRSLLPGIRSRAPGCEQNRQVPQETIKAFQESGVLRALQPKHWGGAELDPLSFYEGVALVSQACPSSAWVLGVVGVHNWQLALFPEEAQKDVWADDASVQISSSYAPTGKVELVEGGYRLSGTWSFSSGCDHCDWAFLGAMVPDDSGKAGLRGFHTFLVPRSDYEISDNWHVAGLAGTGSKQIVIEEAFVPEHRTHSLVDAFKIDSPGQSLHTGPSFRMPFGCVFAFGISVPAIGAAEGALQTYLGIMEEKRSVYGGQKVADNPLAQRRLAEAIGEIDASRAELRHTWNAMWALGESNQAIPIELRTRGRWTAANIVQRCVRAVDMLFESSGGHAIFLDNPMQRYFRDIHAMRAHAINNPDGASQVFGFGELNPGQPPRDLFL